MSFGQILRRERRQRGETQARAAERFGVSQPSYARWESDEQRPKRTQLLQLANYLRMSVVEVDQLIAADSVAQPLREAVLEEIRDCEASSSSCAIKSRLQPTFSRAA